MRILFYCRQFHPSIGGLENVSKDLATELTYIGWDILVCTQVRNISPDDFIFKVLRKGGFWRITNEMRSADCIVMFNVSLKGLLQQIFSGKPLVVYHQSGLFYPGRRKSLFQFFKKWVANYWAKKNIACSQYIGGDYKRVSVLLNPYNDHIFVNKNLENRPHKFLFVGRLVSDKGCDILIQAFKQITLKHKEQFILTVIGDGDGRSLLEEMIDNYGLQKRVVMTGFLTGEQLAEQMNLHEIMIVPSRWEPFGIVALEGLACGCKMIVSNAGGLPEAVGGFARIFESGNVNSLADAMAQELIDIESQDRLNIASHLEKHTKRAIAKNFVKIITHAN